MYGSAIIKSGEIECFSCKALVVDSPKSDAHKILVFKCNLNYETELKTFRQGLVEIPVQCPKEKCPKPTTNVELELLC